METIQKIYFCKTDSTGNNWFQKVEIRLNMIMSFKILVLSGPFFMKFQSWVPYYNYIHLLIGFYTCMCFVHSLSLLGKRQYLWKIKLISNIKLFCRAFNMLVRNATYLGNRFWFWVHCCVILHGLEFRCAVI